LIRPPNWLPILPPHENEAHRIPWRFLQLLIASDLSLQANLVIDRSIDRLID
jgi:hypothetical protein